MYTYPFPEKTVAIPDALDHLIRTTVDWAASYEGLETGPLTILSSVELTEPQQVALAMLVDEYEDPARWLTFDRSIVTPMHTHYVSDSPLVDDYYVLQTLIFTNQNAPEMVLDAVKTVVEYVCPDPTAFGDTANAEITLQIYDITRDVVISTAVVSLNEIATAWNALALAESTVPSTVYRSTMFYGISAMTTGYDCVWQLRGSVSDPASFTYRLNSLQYLFYSVQTA